jgi:hypothetical protein
MLMFASYRAVTAVGKSQIIYLLCSEMERHVSLFDHLGIPNNIK